MKCPSCGSNLQIDNAFCPYCGAKNPVAQKHREDMKRYADDYKKTKEEVIGNTRKFNKTTLRVTAIALTVAAIVGVIMLTLLKDRLGMQMYRKHRSMNAPQYFEQVEKLIEEEDYLRLDALVTATGISYSNDKRMDEYTGVFRVTDYYAETFSQLMYMLTDSSINESQIDTLSTDINYFYRSFKNYSDYGKDNETVQKYVKDIKQDMSLLLKTYLKLADETAAGLETMSEGNIFIMVEEAFGEKKSNQ